MKVFTNKDFIQKCKWLASEVPTVYYSGTEWSKWNGSSWNFDCVIAIKSLLWGFNADRNKSRGGTEYLSNGVADFTCFDGLTKHSTDISQDFTKLTPGEYLTMDNTSHCGIYLGDGLVFECTGAWNKKCMITQIDDKGNRFYNGNYNPYKWTHHGKLEYIDYEEITPEPKPEPKPEPITINLGDSVIVNGRGNASSDGSSSAWTKNYVNTKMKVLAIANGRTYSYGLNQYNEGNINDYNNITAWFKLEDIKK